MYGLGQPRGCFAQIASLTSWREGDIMRRKEDLKQPEETQINSPMTRRNGPARHILAPTDLSNESRKSIKYAIRLAQQFQAKLTLLHVCRLSAAGADNSDTRVSEELQQCSVRAKARTPTCTPTCIRPRGLFTAAFYGQDSVRSSLHA